MEPTSPRSSRRFPNVPIFLRQPWISSASRHQMIWVAIAIGAIVYLTTVVVQVLLNHAGLPREVILWSSDALAGVLAGILSYRLMRHARERHQVIQQRLRVVAELNHEIRNALDLIQMSAYMTRDPDTIQAIGDAIERIERSLQETLEGQSPEQPLRKEEHSNVGTEPEPRPAKNQEGPRRLT